MEPSESGYVIKSWIETLHGHHKRTPWSVYKPFVMPQLRRVLQSSTVLTAILDDGVLAGWIAFEKRPRVSALHWIHTRFTHPKSKASLRRRGIATALFEAADLGPRFVFTHRSPSPIDEQLTLILSKRDVTALHVPYTEWKK